MVTPGAYLDRSPRCASVGQWAPLSWNAPRGGRQCITVPQWVKPRYNFYFYPTNSANASTDYHTKSLVVSRSRFHGTPPPQAAGALRAGTTQCFRWKITAVLGECQVFCTLVRGKACGGASAEDGNWTRPLTYIHPRNLRTTLRGALKEASWAGSGPYVGTFGPLPIAASIVWACISENGNE